MKKSTKALAIGLAVVPCALAMTACGGAPVDSRLVNTNGNYSETSSYSEVQTHMEEAELSTDLLSYRLVVDVNVKTNIEGYSFNMDMNMDTIVKLSGTGDDATLNAKGELKSELSGTGIATEKSTTVTYIKDNKQWLQLGSEWIEFGVIPTVEMTGQNMKFENVFGDIEVEQESEITVTVDQNDEKGTYKVKMEMDGDLLQSFAGYLADSLAEEGFELSSWEDAIVYYIFDNNQFVGAAMDMDFKVSQGILEMDASVKMDFAKYTGEIDFPADIA